MNYWAAAFGFLACAFGAGWLTVDDIVSHQRLAREGKPTTVQIVDRADYSTRRNPEYWLRVRTGPPWASVPPAFDDNAYSFETDSPAPGERDIEVVRWEYEAATPGGQLKVLYLPDLPDMPFPSSTLSGWQPPLVGGALTLAFLAGALVFFWDGFRSRRAPMRP